MPHLPILTDDLSRQIEQVHVEFVAQRLGGIESQPGNPFGVRIVRMGRTVSFLAAKLPVGWMNTIHLLSERDLDGISEVVALYRQVGIKLRAEILPGDLTGRVAEVLTGLGMAQEGFHAAVYGIPVGGLMALPAGLEIHEVCLDDFDAFLDIFLTGVGFPNNMHAGAKRNMQHWIEQTNWRLYLAKLNGCPVAAGVLSISHSIGYLAASATVPDHRNKGCHAALISRRLSDASLLGCELVVGQCVYGSASHRNMQRNGLYLAYTKAVWTER
jgi:hypothetical protein